jgi:hypothetical protein
MIQSVELSRGYTLPIPGMDFASQRFQLGVRADSHEECVSHIEELVKKEMNRMGVESPAVLAQRLGLANEFIGRLLSDKVLGKLVKQKKDEFFKENSHA